MSSKIQKTNEELEVLDVDIKEALRIIWQSVLNIHIADDQVSVFELGADSIDIVEAQSPVFPILKRPKCRSSQEVNGSPTLFSAS